MGSQNRKAMGPLEEWQSTFKEDVLTLHQIMLLRTRRDDESSREKMYPWMKSISDAVTELDDSVRNLKRYVAEERARLASLRQLQNAISIQKQRYALMQNQIPAEVSDILGLNDNSERESDDPKKENNLPESNSISHDEPAERVQQVRSAIPASTRKVSKKQTHNSLSKGAKAKIPKPKATPKKNSRDDADIPVINSVSQQELDAAPQYVKGRLTIEKIERVVESLNKIATAKYELLAKPYRDLNSVDKNIYQDFHDNECDETAGKQFLADTEIKGFGKFRLDATAKSVINVLRHVGALKHVRGKNNITILIIN